MLPKMLVYVCCVVDPVSWVPSPQNHTVESAATVDEVPDITVPFSVTEPVAIIGGQGNVVNDTLSQRLTKEEVQVSCTHTV
jgi:hypothetical protein